MMRSSRTGMEDGDGDAVAWRPGAEGAREHGSLQSLMAERKDCGCPQHRDVIAEKPGNLRALS